MSFHSPDPSLKVISFNIRYDNPNDGEHRWDNRKQRVVNLLKFYQPDVFGLQEALHHQVEYVEQHFPDFQRVGVGRDDGKQQGEYSPLFYNQSVLERIEAGTFWLSTTPDKPSKDWDAALPRIATWALLRHLETGDTLLVCNTHFDHRGDTARLESAMLLVKRLPELAKQHPVILMGDFNSTPASEPYGVLTQDEGLQDTKNNSKSLPIGPVPTFSGFEVIAALPGERIDYIFVSNSLKVLRYATISEEQNGAYPSDHFPVFTEVTWIPQQQ